MFADSNILYSQIGFKGGMGSVKMAFPENDPRPFLDITESNLAIESISSFQFGLFARFRFSRFFSIQPEIDFTRRGTDLKPAAILANTEYSVKTSYIELPVLLRFGIPIDEGFTPGIYGGVYGALKTTAKFETRDPSNPRQQEDLDNVNNTDYGIVVGGFFDFKAWDVLFELDLRFVRGLADVMKPLEGNPDPGKVTNEAVMILLGFRL
jgi:hypothetical protein